MKKLIFLLSLVFIVACSKDGATTRSGDGQITFTVDGEAFNSYSVQVVDYYLDGCRHFIIKGSHDEAQLEDIDLHILLDHDDNPDITTYDAKEEKVCAITTFDNANIAFTKDYCGESERYFASDAVIKYKEIVENRASGTFSGELYFAGGSPAKPCSPIGIPISGSFTGVLLNK